MELKNRGVLVTGGASGLGAACVRLLAQAGAKVVIADLNSEIGETLAAELRGEGAGVFFAYANVASEESIKDCAKAVIAHFGGVNILVNNAGITRDILALRMKRKDWDDVLTTNLTGAFLLTRRSSFEALDGFDEVYAPGYYEDTDYCMRLWRAGQRVVYGRVQPQQDALALAHLVTVPALGVEGAGADFSDTICIAY